MSQAEPPVTTELERMLRERKRARRVERAARGLLRAFERAHRADDFGRHYDDLLDRAIKLRRALR